MKKLFGFMFILLILPCFMGASGCTIIHTHNYNNWGFCGVCDYSICETMTFDSTEGVYSAQTKTAKSYTKYYYKFESHGEKKLTFLTNSSSMTFDRIEIYYDSMAQAYAKLPSADDSTRTSFSYEYDFLEGKTYHLVIQYRNSGTVNLTIAGQYV